MSLKGICPTKLNFLSFPKTYTLTSTSEDVRPCTSPRGCWKFQQGPWRRRPTGKVNQKHLHHKPVTVIRPEALCAWGKKLFTTGGSGSKFGRSPDGRVLLTVGESLLKLVVRDHPAPVFINPAKSRPVKLMIKSAGQVKHGKHKPLTLPTLC